MALSSHRPWVIICLSESFNYEEMGEEEEVLTELTQIPPESWTMRPPVCALSTPWSVCLCSGHPLRWLGKGWSPLSKSVEARPDIIVNMVGLFLLQPSTPCRAKPLMRSLFVPTFSCQLGAPRALHLESLGTEDLVANQAPEHPIYDSEKRNPINLAPFIPL